MLILIPLSMLLVALVAVCVLILYMRASYKRFMRDEIKRLEDSMKEDN